MQILSSLKSFLNFFKKPDNRQEAIKQYIMRCENYEKTDNAYFKSFAEQPMSALGQMRMCELLYQLIASSILSAKRNNTRLNGSLRQMIQDMDIEIYIVWELMNNFVSSLSHPTEEEKDVMADIDQAYRRISDIQSDYSQALLTAVSKPYLFKLSKYVKPHVNKLKHSSGMTVNRQAHLKNKFKPILITRMQFMRKSHVSYKAKQIGT